MCSRDWSSDVCSSDLLAKLPDETVIDGEVIALDDDGRPSFNILQNYGSSKAPVLYFVFDEIGRASCRERVLIRVVGVVEYSNLLSLPQPIRCRDREPE